jgi:indole-3-glycerol phosphate synthase
MGILDEIVSRKSERLNTVKARLSLGEIRARINDSEKSRDFAAAIKRSPQEPVKLIAEIKGASPSKGVIREGFDPVSIARIYEEENVHAVSILTEEDYFKGSLSFLSDARRVLSKPVLRKDFIIDEYQIYESRANGADAILLIAALLGKNQALEYLHLADELGLSVLFEIHDFKELEMALMVDSKIIGINNRNLKTLRVDINTTFALRKEIPSGRIVVSESGIRTRDDVRKMQEAGIDAMLIGTALMESPDISQKLVELMGKIRQI